MLTDLPNQKSIPFKLHIRCFEEFESRKEMEISLNFFLAGGGVITGTKWILSLCSCHCQKWSEAVARDFRLCGSKTKMEFLGFGQHHCVQMLQLLMLGEKLYFADENISLETS